MNQEQHKTDLSLTGLALMFPPLHFIQAAILFSTPNARIPLCWKCSWRYFLPGHKALACAALCLLSLASSILVGLRQEFGLMLACMLLSVASLVCMIRNSRQHEITALPIQVHRIDEQYRYIVHGGPLSDWFARQLLAQPATKTCPP